MMTGVWTVFSPVSITVASVSSDASTRRLETATRKIGFRFCAQDTTALTAVDIGLNVGGNVTGINFRARIETDASSAPSGVEVGSTTTEPFAGPAGTGYQTTGLLTLGTGTGALTWGEYYWLVIWVDSGTPTASNYIGWSINTMYNSAAGSVGQMTRCYNGSDWTTLGSNGYLGNAIFTPLASSPIVQFTTGRTVSNIHLYGTNREGIKFRVGAPVLLSGVAGLTYQQNLADNLEICLYRGDTLVQVNEFDKTYIRSGTAQTFPLTPVTVSPGYDYYLIFRHKNNAGTSSGFYALYYVGCKTAYLDNVLPANFRMCYGTGDTPSGYTVYTDRVPVNVSPLLASIEDTPAASGGGVYLPAVMNVGL